MSDDVAPLCFGAYTVHPTQGLTCRGSRLHVTPKSLSLLWELVRRAPQVVPKNEIFDLVWPGRVVTDAALSSCVRELRKVLDDNAQHPVYLETVHRVGLRFIHECVVPASTKVPGESALAEACSAGMELLIEASRLAAAGSGQLVLIDGPPGAGKSSLVNQFLTSLRRQAGWQFALGGASRVCQVPGAAYQPILQAIRTLCLDAGGVSDINILRQEAPSWLAELPELVDPDELHQLRMLTAGVMTTQMHHELDQFCHRICARQPFVLVLEHLHWADECTQDWLLAMVDRLRLPMLIVASLVSSDLQPGSPLTGEGLHHLMQAAACSRVSIPARKVRPAGEPEKPEDRELLACMGIAGEPCYAGVLAAGLGIPPADVTAALECLHAQGHVLRDVAKAVPGTDLIVPLYRANGTVAGASDKTVLSDERLTAITLKMVQHLELFSPEAALELAPQLAGRYPPGASSTRTLDWYLNTAAMNARRGAQRMALATLESGHAWLNGQKEEEPVASEVSLCLAMARSHAALEGFASPEVDYWYEQARQLQGTLHDAAARFTALWQIWVYYLNIGRLELAGAMVAEMAALAMTRVSPELKLVLHHARWVLALMRGNMVEVKKNARQGMEVCSRHRHAGVTMTPGCTPMDAHFENHNGAVCAAFFLAWADGLMDRPEEAKSGLDAAISHARDAGHPYSLALTLMMASAAMAAAGVPVNARRYGEEAVQLAKHYGLGILLAWSKIYLGWAEARLGDSRQGLADMREGLAVCEKTPHCLFRPFQLTLYAETLVNNGLYSQASVSLEEAFEIAEQSGDRLAWAEMHRLRGELALRNRSDATGARRAEQDLMTALDFATKNGANLLAERARKSLDQARQNAARA